MANLLASLTGRGRTSERYTIDDWYHDQAAQQFSFAGNQYPIAGLPFGGSGEEISSTFAGYVSGIYKQNGPVFACMLVRQMVFAEARFQWQRVSGGRLGDLFGTSALGLLERPWPSGTTGELLTRMEQDASLGGTAYIARDGGRLRRLRPDWTAVILTAPPEEAVESDVAGFLYYPGGPNNQQAETRTFLPDQVARWSPIPDPNAQFRGMSWMTPIVQEVTSDKAAMRHKGKFFENAATPQLAVTFDKTMTKDQFDAFRRNMEQSHRGVDSAYKTLYLGGGADVNVIGKDLQELDFKASQGHGESRMAAASGVGAVVAQLSEGMQGSSLNAGNYGAARRRAGDALFRPLWRSVAAALETVVPPPSGARLWYDEHNIPFLREDSTDAAQIEQVKASTITTLVRDGFTPESAVAAVDQQDMTLLEHTGLTSVQLSPPGTGNSTP